MDLQPSSTPVAIAGAGGARSAVPHPRFLEKQKIFRVPLVRLSSSKLISDLPYLRTPAPHFWNNRLKIENCTCREGVPVCSILGAMDRRPGFVILLNLILFFLFYFSLAYQDFWDLCQKPCIRKTMVKRAFERYPF